MRGSVNILNWHLIFFINLPIGIAVFLCCLKLLPGNQQLHIARHLDIAGAITVTASLTCGLTIMQGKGVDSEGSVLAMQAHWPSAGERHW